MPASPGMDLCTGAFFPLSAAMYHGHFKSVNAVPKGSGMVRNGMPRGAGRRAADQRRCVSLGQKPSRISGLPRMFAASVAANPARKTRGTSKPHRKNP